MVATPWAEFLTERDFEVLACYPARRRVGFGQRAVVLVIDNINKVVGERGQSVTQTVLDQPYSMGQEAWRAIDATRDVIRVARDAVVPVVHAIMTSGPHTPWDFLAYQQRTDVTMARPEHESAHEWRIVKELTPAPAELVIHKTAPSAFFGTPLLTSLRKFGIDTLVVCGNSTSGCIRATVVDAASFAFNVIVPEPCVFDRFEASHAMSLLDMDLKYADVVSLDFALRGLRTVGLATGH